MNNPFNISFAKPPFSMISRHEDSTKVIDMFTSDNPSYQVFLITGARGTGKTVLLTELANEFKQKEDYIVIDLNPNFDMLEQLAGFLYDKGKVKHLFLKKEFNFSFKGFGLTIEGENPVTSIFSLLDKMFSYLKKKDIKVLLTIDEVVSTKDVAGFIHQFITYTREDYNVFLIMTGLYDNIENLENKKNLTFLQRAPRVFLSPLNARAMVSSYSKIFNINTEDAINLATFTKGYAFAYQVLGFLLYENSKTKIDDEIIDEFDQYMSRYTYTSIWKSLSDFEKKMLVVIAMNPEITLNELSKKMLVQPGSISKYKKRLENKGIVDGDIRGRFEITLPRFLDFIVFENNYYKGVF